MGKDNKHNIDKIINEFIDADGYPIKGGVPNNTLEVVTAPGETGEVFTKQAQSPLDYYRMNFMTSPWSVVTSNSVSVHEGKKMIKKSKQEILDEDLIFNKRNVGSDILTKNNDELPSIDLIKASKKDLFIATQKFIEVVNKSVLDQTEKTILINYLLNKINTQDINPDNKSIIINNI